MSISQADIAKQKKKVQKLANQVHHAKVKLDHLLWGPGGLPTKPEHLDLLLRITANLRKARGPGSVPKNISDAFLPDLAYRKLRAQWALAKAELDSMISIQQVPDSVRAARKKMEEKFRPDIKDKVSAQLLGSGEFDLSKDPALRKRVEEAVNEAVRKAKAEKSVGSVVALTETVGAAMGMGLDSAKCNQAIKSAALVAKNISANAANVSRKNPKNKVFKEAAIRAEALSQMLGNEPANQDVILR